MKGNPEVIQQLNKVLANELIAINQYFLHSRMFNNWGLEGLGHAEYHYSIDKMKYADRLIERILFLEGIPNLQDLGKLLIGENSLEMLKCDLRLQMQVAQSMRDATILCEPAKDYVSRELVRGLLDKEEDHIDWLEAQLGLIEKMTLENYLQSQMEEDD